MKAFSEEATLIQKLLVYFSIPFVAVIIAKLLEILVVSLFGDNFKFETFFLGICVFNINIHLYFSYRRLTE